MDLLLGIDWFWLYAFVTGVFMSLLTIVSAYSSNDGVLMTVLTVVVMGLAWPLVIPVVIYMGIRDNKLDRCSK